MSRPGPPFPGFRPPQPSPYGRAPRAGTATRLPRRTTRPARRRPAAPAPGQSRRGPVARGPVRLRRPTGRLAPGAILRARRAAVRRGIPPSWPLPGPGTARPPPPGGVPRPEPLRGSASQRLLRKPTPWPSRRPPGRAPPGELRSRPLAADGVRDHPFPVPPPGPFRRPFRRRFPASADPIPAPRPRASWTQPGRAQRLPAFRPLRTPPPPPVRRPRPRGEFRRRMAQREHRECRRFVRARCRLRFAGPRPRGEFRRRVAQREHRERRRFVRARRRLRVLARAGTRLRAFLRNGPEGRLKRRGTRCPRGESAKRLRLCGADRHRVHPRGRVCILLKDSRVHAASGHRLRRARIAGDRRHPCDCPSEAARARPPADRTAPCPPARSRRVRRTKRPSPVDRSRAETIPREVPPFTAPIAFSRRACPCAAASERRSRSEVG
jgi:hypothetical protein